MKTPEVVRGSLWLFVYWFLLVMEKPGNYYSQLAFDVCNNLFKVLRVIHCQISQHFPVELHIAVFKIAHKCAVVHALFTDSCIDACNPKVSECSLLIFAVSVSVE